MGEDPSLATSITHAHLLAAAADTRKSITPDMLEFYAKYNAQHRV